MQPTRGVDSDPHGPKMGMIFLNHQNLAVFARDFLVEITDSSQVVKPDDSVIFLNR
jgi:hypothetical protein